MIVVDSCGWLEFMGDGPNAPDYARPLSQGKDLGLLLPSICLQEVVRITLQRRGEEAADSVAAFMQGQALLVPHDGDLALEAASVGQQHGLALADSIIYATARRHKAMLWTQDSAFQNLPGVHFVVKKKA